MESINSGQRERRSSADRRTGGERRRFARHLEAKGEPVSITGKPPRLLIEAVGSVALAVLGLAAYVATGLYSAADVGAMRIGLGVLVSSWFVFNFRIALNESNSKRAQ